MSSNLRVPPLLQGICCPWKLHIPPPRVRGRDNVPQSMDDPLHRRRHDRCTLVFEIRVQGDQQREQRQQYQGQDDDIDDLDGCE